MNKYDGKDIYCYKDTNVLINKFNIKEEKQLEDKERKITLLNTIALYKDVKIEDVDFNIDFYKYIHSFLFQEIYDFAGKFRNIVLIKGNTRFCEPQYIEANLQKIFEELKEEKYLLDLKKKIFISRIAYYYTELNAIHPFREGNGRTNRIFIDLLAKKNNYDIGVDKWDSNMQIEAMIESIYDSNNKLINLIDDNIKEI